MSRRVVEGHTGTVTDQHDHYRAFPADGFEARWTTWDGEHTEHLTIRWENEAWTVSGRVGRERVEYVIRLSPLWQVRQFLLFRDLPEPDLWLGTDGHGRWGEMNGAHRPELDGAHEIALDVTPFTLSLPIRRLPLRVGDAFELTVLTIDVETLAVEPTVVTYHRLDDHGWRITRGGTTIEVTVDDYGLVTDIDGAFRRT
jgi:uncharacterized protein